MGRMSHRESRLWLARQQGDFDRPSLTDHYLMKLMSIVASFSGQAVSPDEMKIEWIKVEKDEDLDKAEMDIEDLSNAARQSSEAARAIVMVKASNDPRRRK